MESWLPWVASLPMPDSTPLEEAREALLDDLLGPGQDEPGVSEALDRYDAHVKAEAVEPLRKELTWYVEYLAGQSYCTSCGTGADEHYGDCLIEPHEREARHALSTEQQD